LENNGLSLPGNLAHNEKNRHADFGIDRLKPPRQKQKFTELESSVNPRTRTSAPQYQAGR
jgi:hypothetical protein